MSDLSLFWKTNSTSWLQQKPNKIEQQLIEMKSSKLAPEKSHKINEVCKEFESLFLNYLLKEMRATIPKSGLFDDNPAEKIYTSLFDQELSKNLAQHGGIGLAKVLEEGLSAYQKESKG